MTESNVPSKMRTLSLWSFLRDVLVQGATIQMDYTGRCYEAFSARLDAAAIEREKELEAALRPSDVETDRDCLVLALGRLVRKMEECHADEAFKSVWMINQLHTGPYTGPKYEEEFLNAQAYLKHRITPESAEVLIQNFAGSACIFCGGVGCPRCSKSPSETPAQQPVHCFHCGEAFDDRSSAERHLKSAHNQSGDST